MSHLKGHNLFFAQLYHEIKSKDNHRQTALRLSSKKILKIVRCKLKSEQP